MTNDNLKKRIKTLEQKVQELLEHYKRQQKIAQQLQKEILSQKTTKNEEKIESFSNHPKISTIIKDGELIHELENSIDSYIRDIDNSIAYLEQLQ